MMSTQLHDATPTPSRPEPSAARILIADDDADCRELLILALAAPGVEVCVATHGGELLQLAAEDGPFDLIVTDIDMPWIRGVQVLASFRAAGLETPVLLVTGLTRGGLTESIARLGRTALLPKPFAIAQLRSAVAELLGPAVPG
jgi:CheY-like chemotaxis protein